MNVKIYEKSVDGLFKEYCGALPADSIITRKGIAAWFAANYPKTKRSTIANRLAKFSVNAYSRKYYHVHEDGSDDLLFQIDKHTFRFYDKTKDPPPIYAGKNSPSLDSPVDEENKGNPRRRAVAQTHAGGTMSRDIFLNISPLDHRYSVSEAAVFESLSAYISERAAVRYCARAEIALIKTHLALRNQLTVPLKAALDRAASAVDPDAVYAEEEKTKHNIRALVNVLKQIVPAGTAHLVHLGATSVDILDTALSMRVRDCVRRVILPLLKGLEQNLCVIVLREAETPQVGRTHGQHAVPITFGFAVAEYVSRLGKSILEIERRAGELKGKLAGPVGAYNGTAMLVRDPEELEKRYLAYLGLKPSEHSTQLVEPEYLLRLLLELNVAFGVVANLADDLRNLQRSEIGEVFEQFGSEQVGSSTMPQKRNPWNSEHVKSLWKAFAPRVATFFMDQISEHQRDLSNSASGRFVADYLAGFSFAVERMKSVIAGLRADREGMTRNLNNAGGKVKGGVLAEPAYLLLSEAGIADAHELIRKITLEAERTGGSFFDALSAHADTFAVIIAQLEKLGISDPASFFACPERYRGLAAEKAKRLAEKYGNIFAER
jgi:adenylosuccinate lyase